MSERIMEKWDKMAIPINKISDSKYPRGKGRLPSLGILTGALGSGSGEAEAEEASTARGGGSTTRRDKLPSNRRVEIDVMADDDFERDVSAMTEALMAQVDEKMQRKHRASESEETYDYF